MAFITQQAAAEMLGVTDRTIRTMISDGRLKGYRVGPRLIRIRAEDVETALQPIGGAT